MTSFLGAHFIGFMDAYKDGILRKVRAEDLSFDLRAAECDKQVAAVYCIANDLEPDEWVERLLSEWRELRATTPPPTPSNIVLGES